jgi:hypothetical protein
MEAVSLTGVDPYGVDVEDKTGSEASSEEPIGLTVFHRFWPRNVFFFDTFGIAKKE